MALAWRRLSPWARGPERHGVASAPATGLSTVKTRAIDAAFERIRPSSFADLGGVWAVAGGYTFYALDKNRGVQGCLVDTGVTEEVEQRGRRVPGLRLVHGNFADPHVVREVGAVDVVFLFDVLLHQVAPDWDEVLRMWSGTARCLVIVNPQYLGPATTRLLDLGREEFRRTVPDQPNHRDVFDRLGEVHPAYSRPYGDVHEIWQWGIRDDDLTRVAAEVGFALVYFENAGRWGDLDRFENHAFVFLKGVA